MDDPTTRPSSTDNPLDPSKPPTTLFATENVPGTGKPGLVAVEHEQRQRPAAPGHEQDNSRSKTSPEPPPNEQPRPAATEQDTSERQATANHEPPEDVELVTVEEAVTLFRSQRWQTYASQLKGVADNLRMHELSTVLEVLTHTEDAQKAQEAVHQLYSYIDQL